MRALGIFVTTLCTWGWIGAGAGCLGSSGEPATGTLGVNLLGAAPSGTVYRLRDAIITVQGPTTTVFNTEDDPDQTSLSADVETGEYTASLGPGWRLERVAGAITTPVTATLISDNPAVFTVVAQQRTTVPLRFRVDADSIDMTQGYDIVIGVEEAPPTLVVSMLGYETVPTSIEVFAADVSGDVAPLRTITGSATTLEFPFGVTSAGGEIIVCDEDADAIDFYPAAAGGDIAPTRRIVGPATTLSSPIDAIVFDGEIYVNQGNGTLVVFPLTAAGNVAPTRTITGLDDGANAQFLAIAHGELYVSGSLYDGTGTFPPYIRVYPVTASGTAMPTRTIIGAYESVPSCLSGVVVQGGEVFVADNCNSGIRVFPASANGITKPTRVIAGPKTGISVPWQIAMFRGELYVSDQRNDYVAVFPAGADGNVAPTRVIGGPGAGLAQAFGAFVF